MSSSSDRNSDPIYTLYLDESGSHDLTKVQAEYPIFLLGGVLVPNSWDIETALALLKVKVFGRADLILHSVDIRKRRYDFASLNDTFLLDLFYSKFNSFIDSADLSMLFCLIDKTLHLRVYSTPTNPYTYSLEIIIERLTKILELRGGTAKIIAESRGKKEDAELLEVYSNLYRDGCAYASKDRVQKRLSAILEFRPKRANVAGLQLADMMLYPIGRAYISKNSSNPAFRYVIVKIPPIWGAKILPKIAEEQCRWYKYVRNGDYEPILSGYLDGVGEWDGGEFGELLT
jgi:Protein of unknown function (DUF3800)